ncbi:MAG: hypothetical protein JXA68_03295 [Ignavibacteriales bacterium]|nr:hypothetical protein [Ignavibacteriales bacterium]
MWKMNKVWLFTIVPFVIMGIIFIILGFNAEPWELTDDGYPLDTFWSIMGGSFIFFAVAPLMIFVIWNKRKMKKIQNLLAFGLKGKAKILTIGPTGTEINNVPVIKMELEISIPGREKYIATHKELLNPFEYHLYSSGKIIDIIVDRDKPNTLIIVKIPNENDNSQKQNFT